MSKRDNGKDREEHGHHVIPLKVFFKVWGALIVFTILTVTTSYMDFGNVNIFIAMGIATAKALLVILFFMGLRYEGRENNVTFFLSFLFLAIFVGLTGSDLFYRVDTMPARVDASELPPEPAGQAVDVAKFAKSTPELVARGTALFQQQCVACHGEKGAGDGPAAAALNPKPRNFTKAEGWKNGRSVSALYRTISSGLPGTPMPPFEAMLKPDERFAVAHYLRAITPSPPADTDSELADLQKSLGGGPAKPRIPVEAAMDRMAEEWQAAHPEKKSQ